MIIKNMKKVLSGAIIATYLVVYTAPIGLCISPSPQINAEIQKPALRENSRPSSFKLEGDISISKKNPKISLSVRDSDVKQVLRMFADKAGMNIIFHTSVDDGGTPNNGGSGSSRKVTLDLVNVPLNDAFKMVLQVTGLTYYIDNNTMVVASADAAQRLNLAKQELMILPVKYVDASTLATFLNKNIFSINKPGLSNSQIAITNPGTNEILIFGTKNDYLMAKKIVAEFDVKPLEETFIVNHTTPREMANLLCNVLFKQAPGSSSGSEGSAEGSAAPASSSSGPGSTGSTGSSSSSSGGSSSDNISLGEGIVACQYNNRFQAGGLASPSTTSLSITYFAQRGTLEVLGGSRQQMELIKEFIAKNDKKQPQAYLEISIIELNESGSKEFNNTWNVYSGFFSGSFSGRTTSNGKYPLFLTGDSVIVNDSATNKYANLYTLGRYSGMPTVTYAIDYLIKNSKGRVLANPRIMITNGEKSIIDLSSDYVKKVTSQIIEGSLTSQTERTYEIGSDEGIKVEMTPFISPEGYVTLNIKPEYSTIKEKVYTPNEDGTTSTDLGATLLQRRNLDLKNIRIKDGETLVIGGMIREEEQKTISKIPVLGDLPGVGMFFRNTVTTKDKQELVIMLTPKIIKESEDLVNKPDATL